MNNLRDEICWYKSHITDMEEEFKLILDEKDAEIAELKEKLFALQPKCSCDCHGDTNCDGSPCFKCAGSFDHEVYK